MGPKTYNNVTNDTVKKVVDNVIRRQIVLTLLFVAINLGVSYAISYYINDHTINIIITIALMAISFPTAAALSRRINIAPKMDYEGYWQYAADFRVITDESNGAIKEAIDCLKERFHNKVEHGVMHLDRNGIDLRVVAAKGDVEGGAKIKWEGDPAIFDENSIRWLFIGEIVWSKELRDKVKFLSSEFNGLEYYTVDERDEDGRPTFLTGKLLGCVQDMGHFTLKGDITYRKLTMEDYTAKLSKLNNNESITANNTVI